MASADAVDAYVGLGTNLGDRRGTIDAAFDDLAALPGSTLSGRSSIYESPPWQADGGPYLNAVARLRTSLDAPSLLRELQAIELRHGRTRPYPNAPRTLDLDLLLHGSTVTDDALLTLPHPRLHERAFVVAPLAELAPGLAVPGRGAIATLLAAVAGQPVVRLARDDDRPAEGAASRSP